jgi:hypothetical protein
MSSPIPQSNDFILDAQTINIATPTVIPVYWWIGQWLVLLSGWFMFSSTCRSPLLNLLANTSRTRSSLSATSRWLKHGICNANNVTCLTRVNSCAEAKARLVHAGGARGAETMDLRAQEPPIPHAGWWGLLHCEIWSDSRSGPKRLEQPKAENDRVITTQIPTSSTEHHPQLTFLSKTFIGLVCVYFTHFHSESSKAPESRRINDNETDRQKADFNFSDSPRQAKPNTFHTAIKRAAVTSPPRPKSPVSELRGTMCLITVSSCNWLGGSGQVDETGPNRFSVEWSGVEIGNKLSKVGFKKKYLFWQILARIGVSRFAVKYSPESVDFWSFQIRSFYCFLLIGSVYCFLHLLFQKE